MKKIIMKQAAASADHSDYSGLFTGDLSMKISVKRSLPKENAVLSDDASGIIAEFKKDNPEREVMWEVGGFQKVGKSAKVQEETQLYRRNAQEPVYSKPTSADQPLNSIKVEAAVFPPYKEDDNAEYLRAQRYQARKLLEAKEHESHEVLPPQDFPPRKYSRCSNLNRPRPPQQKNRPGKK